MVIHSNSMVKVKVLFVFLIAFQIVACKQTDEAKVYVIKGSEGIIKILKQANGSLEFVDSQFYRLKNNPKYKIHFIGGGSSRALASIIDQTTDLAIVNHNFSFDQRLMLKKYRLNPKFYAFGRSEIYFILNKNNPILSLRLSQVQEILRGSFPSWQLKKKENIKTKELDRLSSKGKNIETKKSDFQKGDKIILTGRKNSSGNYYWVYKKVLQNKSFHRDIVDFFDDSGVIHTVRHFKHAIGYISKSEFKSSLSRDQFRKLEYKLDEGSIDLSEMEQLIVGDEVKRLLIYDDLFNEKEGVFKLFHLHPTLYIVIPNGREKELKPLRDLFYSKDIQSLFKKYGIKTYSLNKKTSTEVFDN